MATSEATRTNLGSGLEVDNLCLGPIVEYFVCLRNFRRGNRSARRQYNDALMDLILISPKKSLKFIKSSITFAALINVMLLVSDFKIMKFDNTLCLRCIRIMKLWLYTYRSLLFLQLIIRSLFIYIFTRLSNRTYQEITYCMSVVTNGRGWSWSKALTSFSYVWYAIGIMLYKFPTFCNKRWLYQLIFYVIMANVIRFIFTVVLYYFTFPPVSTYTRSNHFKSVTFPEVQFKDAVNNRSTVCGICLDSFQDSDKLRVFNCQHGYHSACIDLWLLKSALCPLCMKRVY